MGAPAGQATLERQGTHALLTTGLSLTFGLGLSVVVARALGPAGKGLLDVASATAALCTLVLGCSLNAGIAHAVARAPGFPAGLGGPLGAWAAGAGALAFGVLALLPGTAVALGLLPGQDTLFWAAFVAATTACGIGAAGLRGALIGRQHVIAANRIDLAIKAALLLGFGAAVAGGRADARAFAVVAVALALALAVTLHLAARGPRTPAPGLWRAILAAALPVHGTNLLHFANQRADVFFVQATHGAREVGLYTLAVGLAQTVLLLSSALAQPLLPHVSAATSQADAAALTAQMCRQYVALGLLAIVVSAGLAPWALPLVFGRDFAASVPPWLILLPGMIGFGLANLLTAYFVGRDAAPITLRIAAVTALVTLAGNALFTPRYGALGAAATSTVAYLLAGGWSVLAFARHAALPPRLAFVPTRTEWRSVLTLPLRFRV